MLFRVVARHKQPVSKKLEKERKSYAPTVKFRNTIHRFAVVEVGTPLSRGTQSSHSEKNAHNFSY